MFISFNLDYITVRSLTLYVAYYSVDVLLNSYLHCTCVVYLYISLHCDVN